MLNNLIRWVGILYSLLLGFTTSYCQSCGKKYGDLKLTMKAHKTALVTVCKGCYD